MRSPDHPCTNTRAWQIKTDNCRPKIGAKDEELLKKARSSDDKRHFKVVFDRSVQEFMKTAVRSAMRDWNSHADKTGIVFDEIAAGERYIKVQFGAYQPGELGALCDNEQTFEQRQKCRVDKGDENNNACAMYDAGRQVIWYKSTPEWIATTILKDIQDADVLDARECADPSKFRTQQH